MNHFKNVCECGIVISQCRCIGPKVVNIIKPCTHKKSNAQGVQNPDHILYILQMKLRTPIELYKKSKDVQGFRIDHVMSIGQYNDLFEILANYEVKDKPIIEG